ncbi:uncharacterized protein LOC127130492 [Lathyrus oleraceus]|uniref:uncharacterized protein LOC127130492 n=1 Tax=Pisum sativum TaxID=3888 RepID=UPI0021D335AD|nr:uncharacterized protein LOC127130492 [Pisum sativum]
MRQIRWLKFLKYYDFVLSYHSGKANVLVDMLSRKSLHMSMMMVRELGLIEQFRDMSLVCEETHNNVKLGMLKLTTGILEDIRKDQKVNLGLIDLLVIINQGKRGDFIINENGVMRFRGGIDGQMENHPTHGGSAEGLYARTSKYNGYLLVVY